MKKILRIGFYAILSMLSLVINLSAQQLETIQVGSTTRSMLVHVPANLPPQSPLLLSLHGLNQDVFYQRNQTQWESVANANGFVVVYPAGINNSWDLSGTRDTDFILAIINNMSSRFGIDRNRVYLSGFSMGGMMTYHAATRIADRIAAFAPVAGYLMGGPNTNSARPIPIIHTHGTTDDVVPYSGVQNTMNAWVTRNGCSTNPQVVQPYPPGTSSNATRTTWGPCSAGVQVVLLTLSGVGHWHSINPNGVNTSQEIWNFVKNYSLNGGGCNPTAITPYVQVNGGAWQQTSTISVNSGAQVRLGPQPTSGGSWSWSGCGTSGSSREQTISPTGTCTATATYTNACGAQTTQTFTINVSGGGGTFNGVYSFVAQHSGKAIDTYNFGTSNGTNIVQWSYWGGDAQRYQVTHLGSGWHRISPVIATGQALDVAEVSSADGANIQTWQYLGGNNQQWRFESAGNGRWKIISRHSGKCLDISGVSTADGANVQQWTCIPGAQNQSFQLISGGAARIAFEDSDVSDHSNFKIYPNPSVNGDFTVDILSDDKKNYRLNIFSVDGKKVFETERLGSGVHNISSGLKKGIYFIKTENNKKGEVKKLIVL